jgi:serine/threonine-protein kinase RsbW
MSTNYLRFNVRGQGVSHTWCELTGPLTAGGSTSCKFQVELEDMAHKQAFSLSPQTPRSFPFVEFRQSLPSQIALISPFVDQLMRLIAKCRNQEDSELEIEMALREALANAMVHGNHEDHRKLVHVACRCAKDGGVSITVQDEGQGFDNNSVPDPTTPENLLVKHGRGIWLMKTVMDEVRFEQGGAVVYMRKKPNARSAAERREG